MRETTSEALGSADDADALTEGTSMDTSSASSEAGGRSERSERGVVLIWFALILICLMALAGFAIDLSNWWAQAERVQKAADAGAHAGVVYLPGDLSSAKTVALNEVKRNGFTTSGGGSNSTAVVTQEPNPNRLRVSVTYKVKTFFTALVGVDEVSITRQAVAEFISPVPMGSPENKLGNDPENADPGTQMWVNISAPKTDKEQGDRYQSQTCQGNEVRCTGKVNDEYEKDGYFFSMKVSSVDAGQPLVFEVFDAAWVNTGFTCTEVNNIWPSTTQLNNLKSKFPDAATRYNKNTASYCAGDGHPASSKSTPLMDTTFIVRKPDNTPWNHSDNPVINTTTCKPTTVRGFNPANASNPANYIYDMLMNSTEGAINPNDGFISFAEGFRRFTPICTIPAGSVEKGEYIIQVRTNARSNAPLLYDSTVATYGHNKMSFRAGFGAAGAKSLNGSRVTISALGKLPIFANSKGADTRFYLARVLPHDAGRTLRISLFDMGESSSPGDLQVLPPVEFTGNFKDCSFKLDNNASLSTQPSQCKVTGISSSKFNGREMNIDVPIPANYTCNENAPTGCWIKMKAVYPANATVNDATTWSAVILGNPIRLVE